MNRRSFLSSLLGAAVAASTRWLPMPAAPAVRAQPMTLLEWVRTRDPAGAQRLA